MTDTPNPIIEAIIAHWGERCPDHEDGCPICDAWSAYDRLRQSATPSTPKDDGGAAFPVVSDGGIHSYGMSLRDWFAGQIVSGMAAYSRTAGVSYGPGDIARRAYQVADAMLAVRGDAP